jgi:hypothetical protein
MNKENAKEFLPLVQALADGKTIQYMWEGGIWCDIDDFIPDEGDMPSDYRIKTEPRTFEMYINEKGVMYPVSDYLPANVVLKRITVQEVLS